MAPAGLVRRYLAWSLDAVPLAIAAGLSSRQAIATRLDAARAALDATMQRMTQLMDAALSTGQTPVELVLSSARDASLHALVRTAGAQFGTAVLTGLLAFAAVGALYHIGFEASRWQASPGKRALRLRVVDRRGGAPGFARAAGRYAAGALSWLTLNLGHLFAGVPPHYLALHDRLSGTRVVRTNDSAVPAWARAWLVVQVAGTLAATVWLVAAMQARMASAMTQTLGY